MEDDYKLRVDHNINLIHGMRQDIDDEKSQLIDRKKQNADLLTELDTQKDILNSRQAEISRIESDRAQHNDLNS